MARNRFGNPTPTTASGTDALYTYGERERDGIEEGSFVMGSADHGYGYVDGFRYGLENTSYRKGSHGVKASSLRKQLR